MARLSAGSLLVAVVVALAACASTAQNPPAGANTTPPPAARAVPARPAHLWPFTKLQGADYVSVSDLAKHFELKLAWVKPQHVRTLADGGGVRFKFEADERDCYLEGVRVFLGAPVLRHKGELWVSKLDVIKIIAPLLRPEDQLQVLPSGPPRLIVLDAGHGGTDPGKQNLKLKLDEKDMTLDVVLRLKKLLELRGYQVRLTRETDTRFSNSPAIDLPWRAEIANQAGADLFLSIHFNAVDPRDAQRVSGSETYVLTPQSMISTQPESDKTMVKEKYPGNRYDAANALLGYSLHHQLITGLKTSDRGFKRYRYAVLRTLNCPGALIEAAYLSNDTEAARVGKPEFRQQIAEAIADGVQAYSGTLARLHPAPDPTR